MLNAGIILSGQQPDTLNTLGQAAQAANTVNSVKDRNALRSLYAEQGAGIASGDAGAINALAGLDPTAALGVKDQHAAMKERQARLQMARAASARAAASHAAQMDAREAAAAAERIKQAVAGGLQAQSAEQWDQFVGQMAPDLAGQFENREMIAAQYLGMADALEMASPQAEAEKTPAAIQALQFRAEAAGLAPGTPEYQQFMANGGRGAGMELSVDPKTGKVTFSQGGPVKNAADRSDPTSPAAMIASIDGILNDPALNISTGALSVLQNIPGSPQRGFGARARQLEGQAFLQAFESLKGAGQITEIEGLKATQAIGRLDTAQSTEDYVSALTELREVLQTAVDRQSQPVGAAQMPAAPEGYTPERWQTIWEKMPEQDRALFK